MEEQTERKAATAVAEEPIKAEGTVETSDTSERSDGAASPPPNCSICLGKLVNTSFTDSCLHQFCFTCLLQWSKIKTECPLCKQTFKSIIHNVRSEEDYDQYHVPRELASQVATATLDVNFDFVGNVGTVGVGAIGSNWDIGISRFMYRSTLGNPNRRVNMILNPHEVARREQLPSIVQQLSRDELRRRQINPSDFRRNVYRRGVWASPLPDVFGRFRECSAELYRRHPAEINRLIPWLNRELQVLLNNNSPHVAYVLRVITEALTRYYIRSIEFRNLIRPYFGIHTEHFTHELATFARTSFDMVGYDQSVIYLPSRGDFTGEYGPRILSPSSSRSSLTSDDSDVRVVDDTVDRRGFNLRLSTLISNSILDMPGPSTLAARSFHNYIPPDTVPDVVLVSSSSSSSDDECEVIGYVKPRHERTPEIIDLSNSETEDLASQTIEINDTLPPPIVIDENQPSTSQDVRTVRKVESALTVQMMEILSSPTYSKTSDSDSDYNPRGKHKPASKKTVKRRKSSAPRKIVRTKGSLSMNRISSSSDSETKHTKRAAKKETKHSRRISISSGTNSEKLKKTTTKNKSKKRDTSESNSDTLFYASSDSNDESKYQNERKVEKNYLSSSDTSTSRSRSSSKSRGKIRGSRRILKKSGTTNSHLKKRDNQYDSDTLSESEKPMNLSLSAYNSYDDNNKKKSLQDKSDTSNLSETVASNVDLTEKVYEETSSDRSVEDLEQHRYYRSRSQCSVCSDNTRTSKRKSKHKEKRNHKSDKSSTKFYLSPERNSMSSLNDAPSSSKHSSDSKSSSRSRSKTKHKSHKKNKTSKRRRSHNNSRSKSKKKATHSTAIEFQTK